MTVLKINDIPALAQNFSWSITSGAKPFFTEMMFSSEHENSLSALVGTIVSLKVEATGGTAKMDEKHTLTLDEVYLTQTKKGMQGTTIVVIKDIRHAMTGKKITCCYNKTKTKNERVSLLDIDTEGDPAKLRALTLLGKEGRYLDWTVHKDTKNPFTMSEILSKLFKKANILKFIVDKDIQKADYILENIVFDGKDMYQTIDYLLKLCRMGLYVDTSGTYHLYSIDFPDEGFATFNKISRLNKVTPSVPYQDDFLGVRPKKIEVFFRKLREIRFVAYDGVTDVLDSPYAVPPIKDVYDQQAIDDWNIVGCVNVVKLGIPIKNPVKLPGEWLHVTNYLRWFQIDRAHFLSSFMSQVYLLLYAIKLYKGVIKLADMGIPRPTSVASAMRVASLILNPLYASFRTLYMIDPYIKDRIKKFESLRVKLSTTYRKQRLPATVYCDHSFLSLRANPYAKKQATEFEQMSSSYILNTEDKKREHPSPFGVSIVSQELGIFKITVPADYQGAYFNLAPYAFNKELGVPTVQKFTHLVRDLGLKREHTMEVVMSVEYDTSLTDEYSHASASSSDKYYSISVPTGAGSLGNPIEAISGLEYARYEEGDKKPLNLGTLQNIANSEAGRLINVYNPKICGLVEASGFIRASPIGHMDKVSYNLNTDGQISTLFDFRAFPPNPSIESTVGPQTLKIIKGQI